MTNKSLELILSACPKLEQVQLKGDDDMTVDATELFSKYTPNIKELYCIKAPLSASQLSMSCPKLEVLILTKAKQFAWEAEEEPTEPPTLRPEITFFSGYNKNIWLDKKFTQKEAKQLQKAFQNVSCDYYGTPLIAKLLEVKEDDDDRVESLLNVFVKKMGMNIDEQVKSKDEVRFNPFKLQFPYDASFDKEPYGDPTYSPLMFYQTDGDSALHLAVKRAHSTESKHITRQHMSLLLKKGANVNLKNKEGKTPICYALNSKVLKTLVDAGADAKVLDNNGWNVLMNVLANPSRYKRDLDEETMMKMVNLLTEKAIDINYEAPDGMNALNVALLCGQLEVAKKIQKMMKKPESSTHKGPRLSTLSCLCLSRIREIDLETQKELIGELLDASQDALAQDDKGQNALHIACLYRRFDLARELITRCKQASELLSAKDNDGYTPLHYAVTSYPKTAPAWSLDSKPLEEIVKRVRKNYDYYESFNIEVTLNDVINAAAVVENTQGCVFDVVSKNGETPMHSLCRSYQNDKAPVMKQLLLNSANPDIQDAYGQTPLLISCFNLDVKVVKKLLKHKVNVNTSDMHGVTPILAACHGVTREIEDVNSHQINSYRLKADEEKRIQKTKDESVAAFREIFSLLIKHNADFNAKDKLTWRTPLHIIAGSIADFSDLIEQLVKELKVDINARDIRNDAPIHFAVRKYNSTHLRKLLELGADVNAIGSNGCSALHSLFKLSDYGSYKGNGEPLRGGFKIFGHSLVYYPSWIWNGVESGIPANTNRGRHSIRQDSEEKELIDEMIVVFFEHADKINFGIQDSDGVMPIHLMADSWREEDNQSAIIINSPIVKKLLTPQQLRLPVPNLFLKYATKEQLASKGSWHQNALESLVRVFQIYQPPFTVPKETALQYLQDIIDKGFDFSSSDSIIRQFTSNARDVWPEVMDIVFQNTPRALYESAFKTDGRTLSTVMHNCLGTKVDNRPTMKQTAAVLMKYAPQLLNAYDGEGRTPLIEAVERNTHSNSEEKITKLSVTIETLLAQPGIEVNKKHSKSGRTALHYAALNSPFSCLIGLFYNNPTYYNNIGIDLTLLALLDAGADMTIKDNEGRTPLDILPSLSQVVQERRKQLQREEKVSLIDKPVIMIDTNNQQNKALVLAFNLDKLHTYQEEENADDLGL
eukprot:TRINITY_DN1076_c0_g1_i1.p1 TRINITY_DN1076_c0_g1~~TRINITY_DN1076_c0_g1_i1.p1  ORF type:complete len:1208 (-),score=346.48 TRINITY_DN1076_c0_g1_i1:48-3536(-)